MSERITNHHDLRVYREACALDEQVFEITRAFPPEEMGALSAPFRGAARAIGGHIAAAWPKRRDVPQFRDRLRDADAALQESRHWLERAVTCRYLDAARQRELEERCDAVGRMLGSLIREAGGSRARDEEGAAPPVESGDRAREPQREPPAHSDAGARPRPAPPGYGRSRDYQRRP